MEIGIVINSAIRSPHEFYPLLSVEDESTYVPSSWYRSLPARRTRALAAPIVKPEAKDPVCGMRVDVARAKHTAQFERRTVYFCCPRRKQAFEQSPQSYAIESS